MAEAYALGEFLWDFLPAGRYVGGAPFNVCAHLVQLGVKAGLISAVGRDELGDQILKVAKDKHVDVQFVSRVRIGLPTGTVLVKLDANSNATYELVQPAAWDEIRVTSEALSALHKSRVLIYGSLAGRSPFNNEQMARALAVEGPVKLFDVNLRPPFADPALVLDLARHAHILKLNDVEVSQLAAWLRAGHTTPERAPGTAHTTETVTTAHTTETVAAACATLAAATNVCQICVTRGAQGALLWDAGVLTVVAAPSTEVKDTVGAGDAFMAGLTFGLMHSVAPEQMLENACRLGAFVASHHGATPLLPREIVELFRASA